MKDYQLLNRTDYLKTLTLLARAAKHHERLMVIAMDIVPAEPLVAELLAALTIAAKRGARVSLIIDAHTFLSGEHGGPGPLFYHPSLDSLHGGAIGALRALEAAGGRYCVTNPPKRRFSPPAMGRSHIKGAVVGDQAFVGGCNLEKPEHVDIMVQWKNQRLADTLANYLEKIVECGSVREAFSDVDADVKIDNGTRLLLDAGVPRQSLIYEEALKLIDEAQGHILLTCQYFPGGPTAQHLAAAHARDVRVEILYSHPKVHGSSAVLHHLHHIAQHAKHLPGSFFAGKLDKLAPKLHAKVLASEQAVMIGSHNYVVQGVQFGTAELALHSTDAAFSEAVQYFIRQQVQINRQGRRGKPAATKV